MNFRNLTSVGYEGVAVRVPLRISFAGGGTDVDPYRSQFGGAVLTVTIQTYVHASIWKAPSELATVTSLDMGQVLNYDANTEASVLNQTLLSACLAEIPSSFRQGINLTVRSTVPPGSGLGASSAVAISLTQAINVYLKRGLNLNQIADLAYDIERNRVGIKGGMQDHYACAAGGIRLIEFFKNGLIESKHLELPIDFVLELESNLLLFWTGQNRLDRNIIADQSRRVAQGSTLQATHAQAKLVSSMHDAFLGTDLFSIGEHLRQGWELKKKMSPLISSEAIDRMYSAGLKAGALGGKLLGAGGGGFILFLTSRQSRQNVVDEMRTLGLVEYPVAFDLEGPKTWII